MKDKHIEFARMTVAHDRVILAIAQMRSARSELSVTVGEHHPSVTLADDTLLKAGILAGRLWQETRRIGNAP
jgi:hypothetical protein